MPAPTQQNYCAYWKIASTNWACKVAGRRWTCGRRRHQQRSGAMPFQRAFAPDLYFASECFSYPLAAVARTIARHSAADEIYSADINVKPGKNVKGVGRGGDGHFQVSHTWPGNIRECETCWNARLVMCENEFDFAIGCLAYEVGQPARRAQVI